MGKQTQWSNDYRKKTYDIITAFVPKGHKDDLKAIATACKSVEHPNGESLNTFIIKAIDERIEHFKGDEN